MCCLPQILLTSVCGSCLFIGPLLRQVHLYWLVCSTQGLETYIHEHSAMYFAHGNMGLATQVSETLAMIRAMIRPPRVA